MDVQKIELFQYYEMKEKLISIENSIEKKESIKKRVEDIEIDTKELKKLEEKINNVTASLNFQIEFQLHKDSKKFFVKIIDKKTKKVIREIPPEQLLEFYANFEKMLGLLFNGRS